MQSEDEGENFQFQAEETIPGRPFGRLPPAAMPRSFELARDVRAERTGDEARVDGHWRQEEKWFENSKLEI